MTVPPPGNNPRTVATPKPFPTPTPDYNEVTTSKWDDVNLLIMRVAGGIDSEDVTDDGFVGEQLGQPEEVNIHMYDSPIIPASTIALLRGKNINLVLDMGNGISWTINGLDVGTSQLSDINLKVTRNTTIIPDNLVNSVKGDNKSVQFELAHNGVFGFSAKLSIDFDRVDIGKFANLFYYNEEIEKLEFMEAVRIGEDGRAELTFVHASAYTMVLSSVSMAVDSAGNNAVSEIDPEQEDTAETNDSVKPTEEIAGQTEVTDSIKPTEESAGQTEVTDYLDQEDEAGSQDIIDNQLVNNTYKNAENFGWVIWLIAGLVAVAIIGGIIVFISEKKVAVGE
jgi:hypothetical protein